MRWQEAQGMRGIGPISCARPSPGEGLIVAGTHSGRVAAVRAGNLHELLALWRGHSASVSDVDSDELSGVAASAGEDGLGRLWSLGRRGQEFRAIRARRPLTSVALRPGGDGREAAFAGKDGTVRLVRWNLLGRPSASVVASGSFEVHALLWWAGRLAVAASDALSFLEEQGWTSGCFSLRQRIERQESSGGGFSATLGWETGRDCLVVGWESSLQVIEGAWEGCPMDEAAFRFDLGDGHLQGAVGVGGWGIVAVQHRESGETILRAHVMPSGELVEEWSLGLKAAERPGVVRLSGSRRGTIVCVATPLGLLVGKEPPLGERARWLASRGRHEEAVTQALHAERSEKGIAQEVGERCEAELLASGQASRAAELAAKRLSHSSTVGWEAAIERFREAGGLADLALRIPPQAGLSPKALGRAVAAAVEREDGRGRAMALLVSLPPDSYDPGPGLAAGKRRLSAAEEGTDESEEMKKCLVHLHLAAGKPEKALPLQLDLGDRRAVRFVMDRGPAPSALNRVVRLMEIDENQAVEALVRYRHSAPPEDVVSQLLEANQRHRAFIYLHRLWEADPSAGTGLHGLQAELYAEKSPGLLMPFLQSSAHYPLERALEACRARGLAREQVYLLGRMGNSREAVRLLLHELGDVPQALELAETRGEEDLWEELLSHCFARPELLPPLLDRAGSRLSALRLVRRLPKASCPIPQLRDRLRSALSNQRSQVMLWRSCADILGADVVELEVQRDAAARRALPSSNVLLS